MKYTEFDQCEIQKNIHINFQLFKLKITHKLRLNTALNNIILLEENYIKQNFLITMIKNYFVFC